MRLYEAIILSTLLYSASNSNTNDKTERCSSQMAKEHREHFLEGQSSKRRGQSQNWTTQYGWHSQWKKTFLPFPLVDSPECLGRDRSPAEKHWSNTVKQPYTRSSATAERQRVSYTRLSRLTHWLCTSLSTASVLQLYNRLAKLVSTLSANKLCDIRTLSWIGHSRSFKVIIIGAGRNPEWSVVVMCN